MDVTEIIQYGIITEKSVHQETLHPLQGAHKDRVIPRYTFRVHPKATKPEIRRAVEQLFGVTVKDVNTLRMPGKARTMRTRKGFHQVEARPWKKAVVTLADGQSIEALHP